MLKHTLGVLIVVAFATLGPGLSSAEPLTPLVVGWEQFFRVDSELSERRGHPVVMGYVLNERGFTATRVQLLIEGLDPSSHVVTQKVVWLGGVIPPGARVYFETPAGTSAASYRVSLFAFDWVLGRP